MRGVLLTLLLLALSGCSAGLLGDAVAPTAHSARDALGENDTCRAVASYAEPLIVDWKAQRRLDLELAMKDGVAVVAYTCKRFELLKGCSVRGSYSFAGVSRKEDVVKLNNRDEVRANLPLSGASLGAELERGASIDLALVMVGKRATTVRSAAREELEGACDGATHIVRAATIGAFAMNRGTLGRVKAAAEIFGAGIGGASDAERSEQNKDGQLDSCNKSTSSDETPPDQCQAALRLELVPVTAKRVELPRAADPQTPEATAEKNPCPVGMVLGAGKCSTPAGVVAYLCADNDLVDCKRQCDSGDTGSCYNLGLLYAHDRANMDLRRASSIQAKACDEGHGGACLQAALLACRHGASDPAPDDDTCRAAARKFAERSCAVGDPKGCVWATFVDMKLFDTPKREHAAFIKRACDLGDDGGCGLLGAMYLEGAGVDKDLQRGIAVLQRSCEGAGTENCVRLAEVFDKGEYTPPDAVKRVHFLRIACDRGTVHACSGLGAVYLDGAPGVAANLDLATDYLRRACADDDRYVLTACQKLGRLLQNKGATDEALEAYMRACHRAQQSCVEAASLAGDLVIDKLYAECKQGDGVACEQLSIRLLKRDCVFDKEGSCERLESRYPAEARAMWETYCARANYDPERRSCQAHVRFGGTLPKRQRH